MNLTRNPAPPTPDQGAITVWSEREHAVSAFRISAPAGAVQVLDLDQRNVLPAASPAAVEDALGPIVFEDVAAYKRSSAWQLATVLEALGLDASELAEVDLGFNIDDDGITPEQEAEDAAHFAAVGRGEAAMSIPGDGPGEVERHAAAKEAAAQPYDFAGMPPGHQWPRGISESAVLARVVEVVGDFRGHAEVEGGLMYLADDTLAAIQVKAQGALEDRWPGMFIVEVTSKDRRGLTTSTRPATTPTTHAAAWTAFMLEHDPREYVLEGVGGRVEWTCPERPSEGRAVAFWNDAREEAWRAFLNYDAAVVVDLLSLTDVWPGGLEYVEGLISTRIAWVEGWTLLERGMATRWAAATHLSASDNDDVEIPTRPACLDRNRPA